MSSEPAHLDTLVEVVFRGRHPDEATRRLCVEAAHSLGPHARRLESCQVLVDHLGQDTEIRVDVRSAEGEVVVDRLTSTPREEHLRAALRQAFAEVARGLAQARGPRTLPLREDRARPEPPPCIWHG